jgi:hypothetical protein
VSWIIFDFECPEHGKFESMEKRPAPDTVPCPKCEKPSERRMPDPFGRVNFGAGRYFDVVRGSKEPTPPGCVDTESFADNFYED